MHAPMTTARSDRLLLIQSTGDAPATRPSWGACELMLRNRGECMTRVVAGPH